MFRFRAGPLRTATYFALGFVGLRVLYRIIFGGAGGSGTVLLDLPQIQLSGPFEHIAVLGPVTTGGLWAAATSAIPFAALILFFGAVNSVMSVGALLSRGSTRGPVRSISRALVIAWATFPALVDAAMSIRVAAALRGRRAGPRLLVPIFEQTIERAIALAATLEVRGFAADGRPNAVCERPAELVDASLSFGGDWQLKQLNGALTPGTLTVITGATGSGKSSLLHSLSGLFQHVEQGEQLGSIIVAGVNRASTPPRNTAALVGVVMQNARLSFAGETVAEELGYALSLRGEPAAAVDHRVAEVATNLGIVNLLDRPVGDVSAGEATLVSIGAAIAARPILLLVDEPLADLDVAARQTVCEAVEQLAHSAGVCVVVAEHNTAPWGSTVDSWWHIAGEQLTIDKAKPDVENDKPRASSREGAPVSERTTDHKNRAPLGSAALLTAPPSTPPLLIATGLSVIYGKKTRALEAVKHVTLDLYPGDIVALTGPNGAGKSSLLHAIALPRTRDTVRVNGRDVSSLAARERIGAIALVPERVNDLFITASVAEECRLADPSGDTERTFVGLLGYASVEDAGDLFARHPRDLSAGERVCLAIALQCAAQPSVLLIDEPTRGLDHSARQLVGAAIRMVAEGPRGAAVLFATHDREFASEFSLSTVTMDAGRLAAQSPTLSGACS